jgi:hypothetical protein
MRLKHQRQKFASNCGQTCVAMLARTSQRQACIAMFGEARSRDCYSDWSDLRRALRQFGIRANRRVRSCRKWESITELAIVACSKKNRNWHWVIYSPADKLIYDPLRPAAAPVTTSRRKPFKYLPV